MTSASEYFEALLGPNFEEGRKKEVTIADIDGPTLKQIIGYCYTGRISITEENIMQIVWPASTMGFVDIEKKCRSFWSDTLTATNCVETFVLADKLGFLKLRKKSLGFICVLFQFVPADDLHCLQFPYFAELLQCHEIHALEDSICRRLVQWVEHSVMERSKHVPDLLKWIRMENLSTQVWFETHK